MCPVLFGNHGTSRASAVSTGGLAALAVKVSRKKDGTKEIAPNLNNEKK